MKKFLLASAMMLGFAGFSFAQTTAAKTTKPAQDKKEMKKVAAKTDAKTVTTATAAKPITKATTAPAAKTDKNGTVLKKDGTPDKRYTAAKPVAKGPVKKDGTPDKRFKENKKP